MQESVTSNFVGRPAITAEMFLQYVTVQ